MCANKNLTAFFAYFLALLPLNAADPSANLLQQPPSGQIADSDSLLGWAEDVRPSTAILLCAQQFKEGYLAVFVEKDNSTFHILDKCATGYSIAEIGIFDSADQELDTKTSKGITRLIRKEYDKATVTLSKHLGLTIGLKEPAKDKISIEIRYSLNDEKLESTSKFKLDLNRPKFDAD